MPSPFTAAQIQMMKRQAKRPTTRYARVIVNGIIANGISFIPPFEIEIKRIAKRVLRFLKRSIRQQSFSWAPLSPEYEAWKIRTGRDPRTLIDTEEYVKSLRLRKSGVNQYQIYVPNIKHKSSGLPMRMLSAILEYGTRDGIPARPHLAPAEQYAKVLIKEVVQAQRSRIRRMKLANGRVRSAHNDLKKMYGKDRSKWPAYLRDHVAEMENIKSTGIAPKGLDINTLRPFLV